MAREVLMLSCSVVVEMLLCFRIFPSFWPFLWGFKLIFLRIMGCSVDIFEHCLLSSAENYSSLYVCVGWEEGIMRICVLGAF